MFFPPSATPNTTAYVSDDKWFAANGTKRFGAFSIPSTVYWPWLSWDTIDSTVNPQQQSAIPRAQLIGSPPTLIFGVIPDAVGSIIRFGHLEAMQAWEVMHYFDFLQDGTTFKKLVLVWLRLWQPAAVAPPAVVVGGGDYGNATVLTPGVAYVTTLPEPSAGFEHFVYPSSSGPLLLDMKLGDPSKDAVIHVDYSAPGSPVYMGTYQGTGSHDINVPSPGTGLRMQAIDANGDTPLNFRLVPYVG